MPRTWVTLTNDDLRTVVEMAEEDGYRDARQMLSYLIAQAARRYRNGRKRRASALGEVAKEGDAA